MSGFYVYSGARGIPARGFGLPEQGSTSRMALKEINYEKR
jgi:hypothetical protein